MRPAIRLVLAAVLLLVLGSCRMVGTDRVKVARFIADAIVNGVAVERPQAAIASVRAVETPAAADPHHQCPRSRAVRAFRDVRLAPGGIDSNALSISLKECPKRRSLRRVSVARRGAGEPRVAVLVRIHRNARLVAREVRCAVAFLGKPSTV